MQFTLRVSRAEKYPAKQHAQRVASALGRTHGLIYLLGQYAYDKEDSDMPKTWYQRRFFYYMSGVDEPNACLTYNCETHQLILYIEEIDWDRVIWTGRGSTVDEAKEKYDVDDVRLNPQLFPDLRQWLKHRDKNALMHILHKDHVPADIDDLPIETDLLLHTMDRCRAVKDRYEVELIKRANEISTAAHLAVLKNVAKASNEAQLSGLFQDVCISKFAIQAYSPIVGSGHNASTLHYTANNEMLKGRQLICLDAGAAHNLYASDVTRTFPISGKWTKEARSIYDLVLKIQTSAIAGAKAGARMIDLHNDVVRSSIHGLLDLGILHGGCVDEIQKAGTIRAFFPHGLGHHLGLETHDCQSIPLLRYPKGSSSARSCTGTDAELDQASHKVDPPSLVPGNVVTIEPGLYFNRQHLKQNYLCSPDHSKYINSEVLEQYWAVGGVRIEDDILITQDGNLNLTTAPKDPDELSKIILSVD